MKIVNDAIVGAVKPLTDAIRIEVDMASTMSTRYIATVATLVKRVEKKVEEMRKVVDRMENRMSELEAVSGQYLEERRRTNANLAAIAAMGRDVEIDPILAGVSTRPVLTGGEEKHD